jgi:hypothetical protein
MWIDILISAALAILTIVMAYLGVHVTLHPTDDPKKVRWYKIGFRACAASAVVLVIWQGVRNGNAENVFMANMGYLNRQVKGLQAELSTTEKQVSDSRKDLANESIRRQQSEKDLGIIVQASGKSTREGVATDFKNSPIKVDVSGAGEVPLKLTPQFIGVLPAYNNQDHTNQGTFMILTNKIITPIRLLVTCDEDIDLATGGVSGANAMMMGGWGGRVTRSNRQFRVGILSPAWAPTSPLLVTIYANNNPGRCSFEEQ